MRAKGVMRWSLAQPSEFEVQQIQAGRHEGGSWPGLAGDASRQTAGWGKGGAQPPAPQPRRRRRLAPRGAAGASPCAGHPPLPSVRLRWSQSPGCKGARLLAGCDADRLC
jgi:hypothetical protein